jgi:glycosyltransferase involved in cell wall biosynthesis
MRIALVTPLLPVPHDPASGRYIHEIAVALSKSADVRVFLQKLRYPKLPGLKPRSYLYGAVDESHSVDGLDVEVINYPAVPALTRAVNGWTASKKLLPRARAFAPDIMLGYWVYPDGDAVVRVAKALGVPSVVGALGSDIHVRSGISHTLTKKVIRECDTLLTVSEAMRDYSIQRFGADPQRVHTITNGYNTRVFKPLAQEQTRPALGIAPKAPLIVYVGRLVREKGLVELLQAFESVAKALPGCQLAILGDGQMKAELHALVSASAHKDAIRLLGAVSHEEVAQWICAADLLTLPSWSEGYPNVVVEALACGRPVVATSVGGIPEIVTADNGILFTPKDCAGLTQALKDALTRHWDHDAIAARMKRTWADVAADTLAVCNNLLRNPRH